MPANWSPARRVTSVFAVLAAVFGLIVVITPSDAHAATIETERITTDLPMTAGMWADDDGVVYGYVEQWIAPTWSFVWDGDQVHPIGGPPASDWTVVSSRSVDGRSYVGSIQLGGTELAFRWDATNGLATIGPPGGMAEGIGFVGDTIVGNATDPGGARSVFAWSPGGAMVPLTGLGGDTRVILTDRVHIAVGTSVDAAGVQHLVRWIDEGPVEDLAKLHADSLFTADNVGFAGEIYGTVHDGASPSSMFTWRPASGISLVTTAVDDQPMVVNRHGQWVGKSCTQLLATFCRKSNVVRWNPDGSTQTLLSPEGLGLPSAINDQGRVVGFVASGSSSYRSFLWDPDCGLTDLGDGGGALAANGISNHGLITGFVRTTSTDAFRMQVHLEPCTPTAGGSATNGGEAAALSWTAVDGRDAPVAHYRVTRDGVAVGEVAGSETAFVDADASAGTHSYTVTAVNQYGDSTASAPVAVEITPAPAAPAAAVPASTAATPIPAAPAFTG